MGSRKGDGDSNEGWQSVRSKSEKRKPVNVFFNNLPKSCSSRMLWDHFRHMRNLGDAFVPNKKDGRGNTFGFLRFKAVENEDQLLKKITSISVDGKKIYDNISKYSRDSKPKERYPREAVGGFKRTTNNEDKETQRSPKFMPERKQKPVYQRKQRPAVHKSYAEALRGGEETQNNRTSTQVFDISELGKDWLDLMGKSFLGKAKNFHGICIVKKELSESLRKMVKIKYIGGLNIVLTFPDKELTEIFERTDRAKLLEHYNSIDPWDGCWPEFERIAWINIVGIPAHVWGKDVTEQIGNRFGKVIFEPKSHLCDMDMSYDRVAILVHSVEPINSKIIFKTNNVMMEGWIREDFDSEMSDWVKQSLSVDSISLENLDPHDNGDPMAADPSDSSPETSSERPEKMEEDGMVGGTSEMGEEEVLETESLKGVGEGTHDANNLHENCSFGGDKEGPHVNEGRHENNLHENCSFGGDKEGPHVNEGRHENNMRFKSKLEDKEEKHTKRQERKQAQKVNNNSDASQKEQRNHGRRKRNRCRSIPDLNISTDDPFKLDEIMLGINC